MALFSSKKNTTPAVKDTPKTVSTVNSAVHASNVSSVLIRPRITEKATAQAENNVYVFEIATGAKKKQVANAVSVIYKVKPVSIRIANNPSKRVFVRGKSGIKSGVRKAYVELKKGDKIEFV